MSGSSPISPTAHYTGYVWARNGLAPAGFATAQGRLLYESLRPVMTVGHALGGPSLETYLLTRHRAIDALLTEGIETAGIGQVIEVAAGLSPRGWRFAARYRHRITYVEADLPEMAERKRRVLERTGSLGPHHRVETVDALADAGPESIAGAAAGLDPDRGLAIVTEGLLGYLDSSTVAALLRRLASVLSGFTTGRYISDVHLANLQTVHVRAFRALLSAFVRGPVHLHFAGVAEAEAALREAGFATARVRPASQIVAGPADSATPAHILEASTR